MIWWRPPVKYQEWDANLEGFETKGLASKLLRQLLGRRLVTLAHANDGDLRW